MPADFDNLRGTTAGAIDVGEDSSREFRNRTITESLYVWRPMSISAHWPEDFALRMECSSIGGHRRFAPIGGVDALVPLAWAGGLALLCDRHNLDASQRNERRGNYFLFLLACKMREYFAREFNHPGDFHVSRSGRVGPSERNVFPEDLGLNSGGEGAQWTITQFHDEGEWAALEAKDEPTPKTIVQYGLFTAAKRNPLEIPETSVAKLFKSALFDLEHDQPAVDQQTLDEVKDRLFRALSGHLDDDTDEFNRWYSGKESSLVKQIAKQKRAPGGEIPQAVVRRALVDLGWQAFCDIGECIETQMLAFSDSLPTPLTAEERAVFEFTYCRRPGLGNLPLTLLWARAKFLKPAILEMWGAPDELQPLHVLYRLLEYYAEMAPKRRAADRKIKQVATRPRVRRSKPAREESSTRSADQFMRVAEEVRNRYNITCGCQAPEWHAALAEETPTSLKLEFSCNNCGAESRVEQSDVRSVEVQRTTFERLAREILDLDS